MVTVSDLITTLLTLPPNMEVTTVEPDGFQMFTLETIRLATASRTVRHGETSDSSDVRSHRLLVIRGPRTFKVWGASELTQLDFLKKE